MEYKHDQTGDCNQWCKEGGCYVSSKFIFGSSLKLSDGKYHQEKLYKKPTATMKGYFRKTAHPPLGENEFLIKKPTKDVDLKKFWTLTTWIFSSEAVLVVLFAICVAENPFHFV